MELDYSSEVTAHHLRNLRWDLKALGSKNVCFLFHAPLTLRNSLTAKEVNILAVWAHSYLANLLINPSPKIIQPQSEIESPISNSN